MRRWTEERNDKLLKNKETFIKKEVGKGGEGLKEKPPQRWKGVSPPGGRLTFLLERLFLLR